MDSGTWNRLTADEQSAVRSLSSNFIEQVMGLGVRDGVDFSNRYSIQKEGDAFVISDGAHMLPGIRHANINVLKALMTDAVQNLGR